MLLITMKITGRKIKVLGIITGNYTGLDIKYSDGLEGVYVQDLGQSLHLLAFTTRVNGSTDDGVNRLLFAPFHEANFRLCFEEMTLELSYELPGFEELKPTEIKVERAIKV